MALRERAGRRRIVAGSAGVLLALGLTSCTGDDEPDPTTAPPATESTSPSEPETAGTERPEVEKPTPPDAMSRDDVAGAEAAAQYFLELYPYVYATGDLTEWEAMSDPECVFCTSVVENVEGLHSSGGHGEGGAVRIDSSAASEPVQGNDYYGVDLEYVEEPSVLVASDGAERDPESGGRAVAYFALRPSTDGWLVREVTIEAMDEGNA